MQRRKIKQANANSTGKHTSAVAIFGSIVIVAGIMLLSYNYILSKKVIAYDYMANVFYSNVQEKEGEIPNQTQSHEQSQNSNEESNSNENPTEENKSSISSNSNSAFQYIGYLEIPKINLKKGFVDKDSKDNDVERNLYIATNSSYPDVDKGNFIIAAHSGTGWKAFFNNLYKLSKNDQVIVTYNNKRYTYNIVNIYKQNKTGKIAIYRNYDKTTLTLVTCTNNDDKTQTIYVAELVSVS
ncbi:MAG: sortase [Bacilli bacterium]|nr:sortase [Bacilli bacterium]